MLKSGWYWIEYFMELGGQKVAGGMTVAEWSDISKRWLVCGSTEPLNEKSFVVVKPIDKPCQYCLGDGAAVTYLEKPGGVRIKFINMNFPCARCKGTGVDPEPPV
jgi:hypothetical protein